jgi:hypothetical protein
MRILKKWIGCGLSIPGWESREDAGISGEDKGKRAVKRSENETYENVRLGGEIGRKCFRERCGDESGGQRRMRTHIREYPCIARTQWHVVGRWNYIDVARENHRFAFAPHEHDHSFTISIVLSYAPCPNVCFRGPLRLLDRLHFQDDPAHGKAGERQTRQYDSPIPSLSSPAVFQKFVLQSASRPVRPSHSEPSIAKGRRLALLLPTANALPRAHGSPGCRPRPFRTPSAALELTARRPRGGRESFALEIRCPGARSWRRPRFRRAGPRMPAARAVLPGRPRCESRVVSEELRRPRAIAPSSSRRPAPCANVRTQWQGFLRAYFA